MDSNLTVKIPLQTQQALDRLASIVHMERNMLASTIIIAAFACNSDALNIDATVHKALPEPAAS